MLRVVLLFTLGYCHALPPGDGKRFGAKGSKSGAELENAVSRTFFSQSRILCIPVPAFLRIRE
jgi:hypothetical protein